ncbi:hypothetical protein OCK74_19765 [Chitinophagaceae bacterium LB-8]|uniref:Uncharacterized protein n=1 Tax=Paraflavisolibacter caeni TaxID=2982496 RepID=A0A9X2XPN6_9BACT|nr:hypothetical protein [Paraflavisolibacter caeni]MCU7551369.1 hypothetical protein [Paraflavisolibacter caeni]
MASILKLFVKSFSFSTLYFITISLAFVAYHYHLYSPTLKIIVPDGYTGEVSLILSNVDKNILTVDSNGLGYVNKWTFKKTYSHPEVITSSGKKINNQCVGFNPSTFWSLNKFCCVDGKVIRSLSFEIVPEDKLEQKQYYRRGLAGLVDTRKLYAVEEHELLPVRKASVSL